MDSPIDQSEKIVHYNNILKVSGEDRVVDPKFQEHFPPSEPTSSMKSAPASHPAFHLLLVQPRFGKTMTTTMMKTTTTTTTT